MVNSDAFVNLAEGAVRSGKTASGAMRFLTYIATEAPKSGDLIVSSKTFDTAVRNVFNPLRDPSLMGPLAKATTYTRGAPTAKILGREVQVITFNNEASEQRLRGMTAAGSYVDEWSLMPKSFHEQLMARHSLDGSQLFGNTNPDNPGHWLKADCIDEAQPGGRLSADWKVWKFHLDDNPGLSEKVKERYRRQYVGLWYRRNILGEWCLAEGAVYEMWDPAKHVVKTLPPMVRWVSLGIDAGIRNPFAGLVLGVGNDGKLYLTHEWRWDSAKQQKSLSDAQIVKRLGHWLDKLKFKPEWVCVDPSALGFSNAMFEAGHTPVNANNAVNDGIRLIASLLSEGLLFVHESCTGWIEECPGYCWDDEKAEKGEDAPIKARDHSLDAGRYGILTPEVMWRPLVRGVLDLAA